MRVHILAAFVFSMLFGLGCATTQTPCACKGNLKLHAEGHVPLGKLKVWPLSDGTLNLQGALFQGITSEEKLKILGVEKEETPLPTSLNVYLVESAKQRILIDAGCGAIPMGPNMGQLVSALAAKNITPESIHAVLLTHLHGDHFGGLLTQDMQQPRFPNATVWVNETELAFWAQTPTQHIPEAQREMFLQNQQAVQTLAKILGDKLKTFSSAETELFPGIKAVHAPGHTPGHTVFWVESKAKKLLVWGDLVHNILLQTAAPQAFPLFDAEPTTATATRLLWMEKAAKEGFWVAGMHLPHPGIGRLEKQTQGNFHFLPIPSAQK